MTCTVPDIAFSRVAGDPFIIRAEVSVEDGSEAVAVADYPGVVFKATGSTVIDKSLGSGIAVAGEDYPGSWDITIDAEDTVDVRGRFEFMVELRDADDNPVTPIKSAFFIEKDLI